jgi:hypothetical protein
MKPIRPLTLIVLTPIATFVATVGLVTIAVPASSNCGGNSAALAEIRLYLVIVQNAAACRANHEFALPSATSREREELSHVRSYWNPGARLLVSVQPYRAHDQNSRRVIAVCDQPYDNVPQSWIPARPTHAAAFADGSVRLISTREFAALDRSVLVPLDEVLAGTAR